MSEDPLPLAGLRVIDVGTRISAPFCAGLLGEMGAEVIKVEDPRGGDFMRTIGPFVPTDVGSDDYSLWWAVEGRGRKGVTLDLRQARGQDLFRRLVARSDVVCENFRPGTLEAWGVGPRDCDRRAVWARISVFGQDGPNSRRPGLDRMGIAYGGLLNLTGYPDRPPVRPGVTVSDYLTGVFAAEAVTAALYRRDRPDGGTGRGGVVDAPLYGSILRILEWTIAGQDRIGLTRRREGNRLPNSAPLDNYRTADGRYVCIVAGSDANFSRLCAAMDRPDLAKDPRWSTLAQRAAGSDEINGVVADWAGALSSEEVEDALHRARRARWDHLRRSRHPGRRPHGRSGGHRHRRRPRRRPSSPAGSIPAPRRQRPGHPGTRTGTGPAQPRGVVRPPRAQRRRARRPAVGRCGLSPRPHPANLPAP